MSTESSRDALENAAIPICFDTNAIWGTHTGPALLESVRERFPTRDLFIPSFSVAEIARQYKLRYGARYDATHLLFVLDSTELNLKVVPFDKDLASIVWPMVTGGFRPRDWGCENRPLPKRRLHQPCAERCRTGDHLIYTLARSRDALLVTEDKRLLQQVANDGVYPGAITTGELKTFLGLVQ